MNPRPLRPFLVLAALAAAAPLAVAPSTAQAQPAKPVVQPPVLQQFVQADYPPEAAKNKLEGSVILQLEISVEGKVTNVTVVNPAGNGFDEAAVAAAKKFTFQPALRDGKPIASKIPYKYTFTLKPVEAQPDGPPGDQPGAAKPKKSGLRGVIQLGNSKEPLQGAKVRVTPMNPPGATAEFTTGADGTWVFNDPAPGKYKVVAEAPGYRVLDVEEEVEAGQSTEVVYRLQAAGQGFEVVIKGERPPREVTKRTIEQRELTRIPGTNGDALRAIQNMPGVARPPGLAGLLIVRGSAPQDTQIFINGTLVPLVYHFGGLTSVIPSEMIERLDFYPGNFSAQYGRVTGGIVDVGIRSPKSDGKYHALAQADFIDTRIMAEGPIPFLKNWTFIAGARRSYVDVWLKPALEAAGAGVTTAPVYYDYQAFVETRPSSNSQLRLGVYGSDDRLQILINNPSADDPTLGGDLGLHTGFWRLQAEYKHQLTDRLRLSTVLSYGFNTVNFNLGALYFKLDTHPITNRLEFSYKLDKRVTINAGQDLIYNPFDINLRAPQPPRPGEPSSGPFVSRPPRVVKQSDSQYLPAAYVEAEVLPTEHTRLVPGVRLDYNRDSKKWDLSPRFNARHVVRSEFPKTTLKGGIGVFHQPPQPQETNPVFGTPGLRSNRAIHYTFGVEQQLTRQVNLSVEGFYKQLDGLVARTPSANGSSFNYGNQGSGYVVGSEFLLRYNPDSRFFGWLAYTLSRSTRRAGPNEPLTLFQYDQTHIMTVLGSYRLGRGWEFGARFRVISGSLATPCLGGIYSSPAGSYACISGEAFSERLPTFHQLDLRVDKRWDFQTWKLSWYLDVLNVYNRGNVEAIDYNYNFTKPVYQTGLPFLPSVGLRGEFLCCAVPLPWPSPSPPSPPAATSSSPSRPSSRSASWASTSTRPTPSPAPPPRSRSSTTTARSAPSTPRATASARCRSSGSAAATTPPATSTTAASPSSPSSSPAWAAPRAPAARPARPAAPPPPPPAASTPSTSSASATASSSRSPKTSSPAAPPPRSRRRRPRATAPTASRTSSLPSAAAPSSPSPSTRPPTACPWAASTTRPESASATMTSSSATPPSTRTTILPTITPSSMASSSRAPPA